MWTPGTWKCSKQEEQPIPSCKEEVCLLCTRKSQEASVAGVEWKGKVVDEDWESAWIWQQDILGTLAEGVRFWWSDEEMPCSSWWWICLILLLLSNSFMIGLILFYKLFLFPNFQKFDQYLRWDISSLNSLSFPLPSPKLISVFTCHKKRQGFLAILSRRPLVQRKEEGCVWLWATVSIWVANRCCSQIQSLKTAYEKGPSPKVRRGTVQTQGYWQCVFRWVGEGITTQERSSG